METMSSSGNRQQEYTLADIQARRDKALADVRASAANIRRLTGLLFEPPRAAEGRWGVLMGNFDRAFAIFDGIMLGAKVVGRVRKLVRRR